MSSPGEDFGLLRELDEKLFYCILQLANLSFIDSLHWRWAEERSEAVCLHRCESLAEAFNGVPEVWLQKQGSWS